MVRVRRAARDWSVVFFGALAVYLSSVVLASRLGIWLFEAARRSPGWTRVALALLVLDATKLPGLLPAGWVLSLATRLPPVVCGLGLVGLTYALELTVAGLLGEMWWARAHPGVALVRAAAAAALVLAVRAVVRWRRAI